MRLHAAITIAVLAPGCFDEAHVDNNRGETTTMTLAADENGHLIYCNEAGECRPLPNPNACDSLLIDIELATGLGKTRDVRRRKNLGGSQ